MIAAVFVFAIMDASMKRLSDGFAPFQVAAMRCWSSLAILCAQLLMTALSVPLRGARVAVQRWLAITTGLAGALLILRPTAAAGISMLAVGAAALSAVSYALSALVVPALSRSNDSTSMVFWSLAISGAGCAALRTRG